MYHSRSYSVTYLRILLRPKLRPKLQPNLVYPNGLQNQAVPHMYIYNLQTIQEIHRHGTTMTIWVDQLIPSGPRALRIDTMTLRERCQYHMCMMGQHLQQRLESANLLTHTPLRISCIGSVAVAVVGEVRSPSNCNAMVQVYGCIAVCIFFLQ